MLISNFAKGEGVIGPSGVGACRAMWYTGRSVLEVMSVASQKKSGRLDRRTANLYEGRY